MKKLGAIFVGVITTLVLVYALIWEWLQLDYGDIDLGDD